MSNPQEPEPDSVRMAMDQAWRDHHHARNQTWRALQIVAALAAGLVGVDLSFKSPAPTIGASVLTILAAVFGMAITRRHRNDTEIRKFTHIDNCEAHLKLHTDELISGTKIPEKIEFSDLFRFRSKNNTSLFILRMHAVLLLFAVLFAVVRCWVGPDPTNRSENLQRIEIINPNLVIEQLESAVSNEGEKHEQQPTIKLEPAAPPTKPQDPPDDEISEGEKPPRNS